MTHWPSSCSLIGSSRAPTHLASERSIGVLSYTQALRDVLPVWACQASCFMAKDGSDRTAKTSEVAGALKQWLTDPDCEVSCTEPIKEARVKECLEELYREQLRYGTRALSPSVARCHPHSSSIRRDHRPARCPLGRRHKAWLAPHDE